MTNMFASHLFGTNMFAIFGAMASSGLNRKKRRAEPMSTQNGTVAAWVELLVGQSRSR